MSTLNQCVQLKKAEYASYEPWFIYFNEYKNFWTHDHKTICSVAMGFKVFGETGHFFYLGNGTFHALGEGTLYFGKHPLGIGNLGYEVQPFNAKL